MNVKLKVLTAGVLFFTGQAISAQQTKTDNSTKEKEIEEVVVVGFGRKQAVKEITGATSTLKAKAIEDVPVASVDKMLQGRVTGVQTGVSSGQPGGFANIRVRGNTSINGSNNPIFIIDGVRIASGDLTANNTTANILANLNMNDIENITVLKDATSTAVYGADAGAGVVIITTKSGRKGKARFNLNFSNGFNDRAVHGHRGMTGDEYRNYLTTALINAGKNLNDFSHLLNSTTSTDWRKATENRQSYTRNVDLGVSGGSDRMTYYLSGNYFDQEGVAIGSSFKKLGFTSKIDYKATDKLSIGTDIQGSYSKTQTLPGATGFANPIMSQYFLLPTEPLFNPDGSYNIGTLASNYRLSNGLFNNGYLVRNNSSYAQTARVFANLKLSYQIAKNLTYRFTFGPEYINIEEDQYRTPVHGDGYNYKGLNTSGVRRYFNFNVHNVLEYNFNIDKNNFIFSAIQEAYRSQLKTLTAIASVVGTESLQTLSNFVKMESTAGTRSRTSRYGYALTGHYDFDKLILIDASYRRDVMDQFTPGKKGGNFWSAGIGLDLARLNFIQNIDAISQLKFRASYGKIGNRITATPYSLYAYTSNYNNNAAFTYSGIDNPNLSWETVKPFNIGLDFGFFNNRLSITAEYYNKKTEDLVYSRPLDISQGLASYLDNVGSLVNKGFEFSINADIFKGGRDGFNWSIGANLSTLKNQVTNLFGGDIKGTYTILSEGQSLNSFYLRKWAGVDPSNGKPLWYINGEDGETTSNYAQAQQAIQGSSLMKVFGGFNTDLSHKGFAFNAQFTYGFGGKIYDTMGGSYLLSDGYYTDSYPGYADQLDYWTPTNPNAANPAPIYGGNNNSYRHSTRSLYKSDYIRLSSAKLSYTFNNDALSRTGLSSLQIYVVGNNIWTYRFDDRLKLDPEIGLSGNTGAISMELPIMKSYSLGVNIGF